MVIEPAFGTFGSVGRCQVLLENEISISIKLVSRREGGREGEGKWCVAKYGDPYSELSSAFNPSKCTLTAVNTHPSSGQPCCGARGAVGGSVALLKGLTSVVVLRVERAHLLFTPPPTSLPDLRFEPATFGLQVQLSNH